MNTSHVQISFMGLSHDHLHPGVGQNRNSVLFALKTMVLTRLVRFKKA